MIRLLVILSVAGMLLCVVCISSAAALGGREIATKGWSWNWDDWAVNIDEDSNDFSIEPAEKGKGGVYVNGVRVDEDEDTGDYSAMWVGASETREFPWSGAGEIEMGFPGDIIYTQGPTPKLTVTGPTGALDRFRIDGAQFELRGWRSSNTFSGVPGPSDISGNRPPRLKIEVTAPAVSKFDLSGTETLEIRNYDQDSLTLDLSGASKVTGKGKARLAVIDLDGASSAELGGLNVEQMTIDASSASRAVIAPTASVNIDASGAAKVTLTTKPSQIIQDIDAAAVVEQSGTTISAKAK